MKKSAPSRAKTKARTKLKPKPRAKVKAKAKAKAPAARRIATAAKVKPIPDGMRTVTPHLTIGGAAEALKFYAKAFGAKVESRINMPNGNVLHAAIKVGDSIIMLNDEFPEMGGLGPKSRGGTTVTVHLCVDDVDTWYNRAVKAGATVVIPLDDMFWGDRYGVLLDPFGHQWAMATRQRNLTPKEMQKAASVMFAEPPPAAAGAATAESAPMPAAAEPAPSPSSEPAAGDASLGS